MIPAILESRVQIPIASPHLHPRLMVQRQEPREPRGIADGPIKPQLHHRELLIPAQRQMRNKGRTCSTHGKICGMQTRISHHIHNLRDQKGRHRFRHGDRMDCTVAEQTRYLRRARLDSHDLVVTMTGHTRKQEESLGSVCPRHFRVAMFLDMGPVLHRRMTQERRAE